MKRIPIILASASKRRSRILRECGIAHTIVIADVEERMFPTHGPDYTARYNARIKAQAIAHTHPKSLIIAADTIVVYKNKIIGKPKTYTEARKMLAMFSRKTLSVYTGICIVNTKTHKNREGIAHSQVHVRHLHPAVIERLLKTIDPLDRAGGFSIEGIGAYMFDSIQGSFYNVLGLPAGLMYDLCKKCGIDLIDYAHPSTRIKKHGPTC